MDQDLAGTFGVPAFPLLKKLIYPQFLAKACVFYY